MAEILYPSYREYVTSRVQVNDAMTALLAGSRLAAHTLQLTAGSQATLGQLFPAVEHIGRFNLRSDAARLLLENADFHIASVAVPYALATHEDFVMDTIAMVEAEGFSLSTRGNQVKAWNMHTVLFESLGEPEPGDWIESFHVLREMRNCITHQGAAVSQRLRDAIAGMSPVARTGWEQINLGLAPERLDEQGKLALTAEHVFTAFAVTKGLGREINALLGKRLSRATWARVLVEDYNATTTKPKNSSRWRRSLLGYASNQNYIPEANLTEPDIEQAARSLGAWTVPQWS